MAGDWEIVNLGSLASDRDGAIAIGPFGSAMKADVYTAEGVPVIRGTNISSGRGLAGDWVYIPEEFANAMPRCVVRSDDLVFPHRGAIGEVALVPNDRDRYFLSTSLMKITFDRHKADHRFMYYYFRAESGRAEIMRFASQVGTPGIGQPLASLRQFKVPCPPLSVQSAVADLLWSLDDKIDLNWRISRSLEEIALALFKSWFVDFDPVRAKAEGRSASFPMDVAALFPSRFDGEGLPEGWRLGSVTELLDVNPSTPLRAGSLAPYVDMASLPTSGPSISGFILREASSGSRFQRGDTLVARITPCLENGKTALVDFLADGEVGWGSTEFIVLRPRGNTSPAWPYLLARQEPFRLHLIAAMTGSSGRQRVPPSAVSNWEIVVPPAKVIDCFGQIVDPLFERIRVASEEAASLSALRDTLIPRLMSGELRINGAGKAVAA